MRQIALVLYFLTCFIPRIGSAGEMTVKGLCQYLLAPPSSSETPDPWEDVTLSQVFKYFSNRQGSVGIGYLNQSRIVEIDEQALPTRQAADDRRTIIFSLGKKWQTEKRDPDSTREIMDDGYWAAVKLQRDMSGLKKEPTVESCVARAWQFGVSDDTLQKTMKLMDAANDLKRKDLERASFEAAQDSLSHYENAEVVPIESIEEIASYLKAPQNDHRSLDLILILHASHEGLLIDASESIVPRAFFKRLGQNSQVTKLKSIAIFSCYPDQVAKFYDSALEHFNASGGRVFFPIDNIHFGDQNTVPLNAFDVFSEKHARALSAF